MNPEYFGEEPKKCGVDKVIFLRMMVSQHLIIKIN